MARAIHAPGSLREPSSKTPLSLQRIIPSRSVFHLEIWPRSTAAAIATNRRHFSRHGWSASFCEPQRYSCIRRKKNTQVSALLRRIGMLADQHNSLPQCELLVGPMLHGLIEGGTRHENRTRSGDNPSDMQCVPIPQLHAKAHVGDVMQVWVLKLPKQFVYASKWQKDWMRPSSAPPYGISKTPTKWARG